MGRAVSDGVICAMGFIMLKFDEAYEIIMIGNYVIPITGNQLKRIALENEFSTNGRKPLIIKFK